MKNSMLLLLLFLAINHAWAESSPGKRRAFQERVEAEFGIFDYPEIGSCRYEPAGDDVPLEQIYEDKKMNLEECKQKARKALADHQPGYSKVFIRHQSQKKVIVIRKEK